MGTLPKLPQERKHRQQHHKCSPPQCTEPATIDVAQPLVLPNGINKRMDVKRMNESYIFSSFQSPISPIEDNWKYRSRPKSTKPNKNPIHQLLTAESFMTRSR